MKFQKHLNFAITIIIATTMLGAKTYSQNTQHRNFGKLCNNLQAFPMEYLRYPQSYQKHVIVCAHRGAFGSSNSSFWGGTNYYFPENTIAAMARAAQTEVEMIELDIKLSHDGVPMISHDWTLGRMTNFGFNPARPTRGGQPGNRNVAYFNAAELKTLTCRSFYIDGSNNYKIQYSHHPLYKESFYKMISLDDALNYINTNRIKYALSLDIKKLKDVKKCLEVVRKYQAYDYVIFKINADVIYSKTNKREPLVDFIKGVGFKDIYSPGAKRTYSEKQYLNIVPIFTTNMVHKINMTDAYRRIKQQPWYMTTEVNVKEGGIGETRLWRAWEIDDIAKNMNTELMGIFHAVRDAKGEPNFSGKFFNGTDGKCCYGLDEKLYKGAKSYWDKIRRPRQDYTDNRWNKQFIFGGLNGSINDWKFRWITTDEPTTTINWLKSKGLRPLGSTNSSLTTIDADSYNLTELPNISSNTANTLAVNESYYYNVPVLNCYERIQGTATKVSAKGVSTVVAGSNKFIYVLDDSTNTWRSLSRSNYGLAEDLDVTDNGTIYHVGTNNKLYANNGEYDSVWNFIASPLCKKVAIGGMIDDNDNTNFETMAIIGTDNKIYTTATDSIAWQPVNGTNAKELAVDHMGDTWYIDYANKVYKIEGGDSLIYTNGKGTKITCGTDGSVMVIGMDGNFWGYNAELEKWENVYTCNGAYKEISLAHASHAVCIKQNGEIWKLEDCTPLEEDTQLANDDNAVQASTAEESAVKFVENNVKVFPNPAHDKVTVQLAAGMEKATVTIVSALGTTVATDNTTGLQRVINIAGKPSGTYLVRVTTKDGVSSTQKLIIQ